MDGTILKLFNNKNNSKLLDQIFTQVKTAEDSRHRKMDRYVITALLIIGRRAVRYQLSDPQFCNVIGRGIVNTHQTQSNSLIIYSSIKIQFLFKKNLHQLLQQLLPDPWSKTKIST